MLTRMLILSSALVALASCVNDNPSCAGWKPMAADEATVVYMATNDPSTLTALISHNEFGHSQGCW